MTLHNVESMQEQVRVANPMPYSRLRRLKKGASSLILRMIDASLQGIGARQPRNSEISISSGKCCRACPGVHIVWSRIPIATGVDCCPIQ